jgi:ribonuclease J
MVSHHASGHAYVPDLQRLVAALAPKRVVPIHSFAGDRFAEFFPRVDRRTDGEWWEV